MEIDAAIEKCLTDLGIMPEDFARELGFYIGSLSPSEREACITIIRRTGWIVDQVALLSAEDKWT